MTVNTFTAEDAAFADQDAALVWRAQQGDETVWSHWHELHYPFVYRYALSRLANQHDAEDVAAQVFLEAFKGISRYRYQGKPVRAWLYGIAHHLVSRRHRERSRSEALTPELDIPQPSHEDTVVGSLELRQALSGLKREQREVLILRFIMDLPTSEVAAIIGKTETATYSLQARGLAALRKYMTP